METREMIEHPARWPWFPLLPVKKYINGQSAPVVGVIIEKHPNRVYRVGLFDLRTELLATTDFDDFASLEDLLAAGWEVD